MVRRVRRPKKWTPGRDRVRQRPCGPCHTAVIAVLAEGRNLMMKTSQSKSGSVISGEGQENLSGKEG